MVKPADVKIAKIPAEAFPKGAFSKVEDVLDRPVISNILLDEPILEGRLAAKGSGLGLAPTIPVGMRAVTVRVNDVAGVAGFVLPGMHVDVLVTGRPPDGDGDMTTTCLQNMLVLSAGQTMQPDARGQAIQAPTVTLLATPEQAETLTLANNDGRIQLVLRNSSDSDHREDRRAASSTSCTAAAAASRAKPPAPAAAPQTEAEAGGDGAAAAGRRSRGCAPPPPAPPPPDQMVVIRGTHENGGNASEPQQLRTEE